MRTLFSTKAVRGVSLIESVMTLGVMILLITGLVVGMTLSLRNAQASKARSLAIQYAQEALEIVRRERDTSWITFAERGTTGGTEYCMDGNGTLTITGSCAPFTGSFSRKVTFTLIDSGKMDVVVTVFWVEGSGTKQVSLKTTYTRWK